MNDPFMLLPRRPTVTPHSVQFGANISSPEPPRQLPNEHCAPEPTAFALTTVRATDLEMFSSQLEFLHLSFFPVRLPSYK